jgi:SPP1 gp7 family putative phage head morphogenesis protein
MRLNLARMVRPGTRRKLIRLRPIIAPSVRASDLFAIYRPVCTAWANALPGLLAEYERTLSAMTTDAPAGLSAQISQVEAEGASIILTVRARLAEWAARIERWQRSRWQANVLSATGVDLSTLLGPGDVRETLETVIERNVGLIRSVSDETRRRVADAVFRGLTNRTPTRELARELREAVAMERRRAIRVASDQTSKLAGALNDERRRQAGIDSWRWVSSGKTNYRPEHKARNGKLYSDNPSREGSEYEGQAVLKPPSTRPGEEINCGCTSVACLILD